MIEPETIVFTVEPEEAGQRLDRLVAARLADMSRSRVQALIAEGFVRVGAERASGADYRVRPGEAVSVRRPPPVEAKVLAEPIPLPVVYEDDHLLVIDKPTGLVVHPAPGHAAGTLVNALLAHCGDSLSGIGGVKRPGIVHRLDKDTSGLLAVAKTEQAHRGLSDQFAAHGRDGLLKRAYAGLCWGVPERRQGVIDASIGRSRVNRKKMAVVPEGTGRRAVTRYEIEESFGVASLMRFELETGRTHQIRVHMSHIGHPLMGDAVYGAGFRSSSALLSPTGKASLERLNRQALHAAVLGFEHPVTKRAMEFASPLPEDIERLTDELRKAAQEVPRRKQ